MTKLFSCMKKYTYDADKAVHPKVTVANAIKSLKKAGIRFELNNITGYYPLKIPAYTCIQTNKQIEDPMGDARSWGKGFTDEQAKASTLMELIERRTGNIYCLNKNNAREESETIFNSWDALADDKVSLDSMVYHTTVKENKQKNKKIISRKKINYTKFYSLTEKRWKFFPLGWHLYFNGTNGLAAGNTIEEAILQALYEVIERHNTAVSLTKPAKSLSLKNTSTILKTILDRFPKECVDVKLFDITTDIEMPTVYCAFLDKTEKGQLRYAQGWGTSSTLEKSAIRALTEAALVVHQKRYSVSNKIFPVISDNMLNLIIGGTKAIEDIGTIKYNDFLDELEKCVYVLKRKGYEVLFKDITSKELKIPVAYVVCTNTIKNEYMTTPRNKPFLRDLICFYDSGYLLI